MKYSDIPLPKAWSNIRPEKNQVEPSRDLYARTYVFSKMDKNNDFRGEWGEYVANSALPAAVL